MPMKPNEEMLDGVFQGEESYVFNASASQKRLWFLDELIPGNPAYNLSFPLRLRGRLNLQALRDSLNAIVERHEALRTRLLYDEGVPVQVVAPGLLLPLPVLQETGLGEAAREARAMELAHAEALKPFQLAKGPLIRAHLVEFADEDHLLLLSIHHIIIDGWSVQVLFQELETHYAALCQGETAELPELDLQYGDYSVWQEEWLESEAFAEQMQFWKKRLQGHLPLLDLPMDRPRKAQPTSVGGSYEFAIGEEISAALEQIGHRENATAFMVYLTALQVFLYRYSGQDDFCIGTLDANRNQDGLQETIGFFVNTLVHRAQLKRGVTFRERLQQVQAECLEMMPYAEVPFDKIVEEVSTERSLHHTPLFQVLFECLNESGEESLLSLPGVEATGIDTPDVTAKFDFALYVRKSNGRSYGKFEYNAELFDPETVERMASHFLVLLEGLAANPDGAVESVPLLTKGEWQAFEAGLGALPQQEEAAICIHQRFEQQAERTPDAVAVEYEGQTLTYRELNEQSNRLARLLLDKGVQQEDLVVLCLERSNEMITAILGVLKAGAAYVPVDPASPAERTRFILEDANASVLVTQEGVLEELPEGLQVIELGAVLPQLEAYAADNLDCAVHPSNLAYVIYTSGSTGKPKGVLIEHGNVHRLFAQTEQWYGFGAGDVWTLFHSYAFDFSVWEIWGALFYGGRLVVVPYWVSRSPELFYQLLVDRNVTVLNQTPSSFRQLIGIDQQQPSAQLSLRYVIFGGEALDFRVLRPWFDRHGDQQPQLVNMYGITETTVHVTYRVISAQEAHEEGISSIGVPIPDLKVHVLDELLQPVPVGVFGEMYVEGAGVARGYHNRPELTAERFLAHPYGSEASGKLYKTGDVARKLPNGELEYRGRADTQVKIRGFRIELGEIEAALLQHPDVAEAVVAVKTFPSGSQGLVGYVVPVAGDAELQTESLRGFLAEKVPEYMVPSFFMKIDSVPVTINGKTDVRALPAPDQDRSSMSRPYEAPATDAEREMAEIWARVLQVERVGVTDNYFELGGDSIRSLQILYQARTAGMEVGMQELFKHPSVRSLVQAISANAGAAETEVVAELISAADRELLPAQIEDAYPLSQSQLGMLFHSKMDTGLHLYHNVHSFRLKAPYQEAAWKKAVGELAARHAILRTSFDLTTYSVPMQLVHREVDVPMVFGDLRDLSEEQRGEAISLFIESERNNPIDWTQAPIMRFAFHRLDEETFQLGITEHHAILDGWSVATLQTELFGLYLHHLGLEEPLPDAPVASYKEFISLEQQALRSEATQTYWKQQLSGATLNQLPRRQARIGEETSSAMGMESVEIAPELSQNVIGLAKQLGVPVKSVLLAAHLRVVSLLCSQDDVLTGVVFNGRPEQLDSERALGMFLHTLPFRVELKSASWRELIASVFEKEQETLPYRHYPLAQIQQDQGGQELFETFFNYTHFHVLNGMDEHAHLRVLDETGHADTSFTFGAEFGLELDSAVRLDLRYDQAHFSKESIERIAGYFTAVLGAMTEDADGDHKRVNLLSKVELQQLEAWNDTERDYPVHCIHDLFEQQVAKTPDRTALHFEGEEWTYQHLNEQANKIARVLQEKGVGAETKVGLLFERSPELVASLYGILKAGGAYVPFDPEFPEARLKEMFEDADINVLLTQRKWLDLVPASVNVVLVADELLADEELAASAASFEPAPYDPDTLAYMIYTSGSTGKPKGAMITHRSICNRILWMQEQYGLSAEDVVLQKTPYSFDVSVWEFIWPLVIGAKLVIARPGGHKDPRYLTGLIAAQGVTTLHFVPSMLNVFVEGADPAQCASLRLVFCSGEALPFPLQQEFLTRYSAELHNLYGPTEAAVDVTYWECRLDSPWPLVPIGRPVANTQMHILDEQLQQVPIGSVGELYIGGVQVGRGYHDREEMTRERFLDDPFRAGGRLYRTGDLARFLPDGNIEYLGRNDSQVKIRGLRIELSEVERVLNELDAVQQAVVAAPKGANGEPILIGYTVADPARLEEIEAHLQAKLPLYMVPQLVLLDRIPVNHNGKADYKALAALGVAEPERREGALVAPRDELEAELVLIWEELLMHSPIGIEDHFFKIGGHSIAAIRLISRIAKRFDCELPLNVLFKQATIRELAELIRNREGAAESSPLVSFTADQAEGTPLFLVHPIGGNTFCYATLASQLQQNFHVYALQASGLDGSSEPLASVEEMAASYLTALRTVQPEGPYHLGGWSFGGVVAFEMARQLQAAGEEIAMLTMFDSFAPIDLYRRAEGASEEELLHGFLRDLLATAGNEASTQLEELLAAHQTLGALLPSLREQGLVPHDLDEPSMEKLFRVYQANVRAQECYQPQQGLSAPTLLILANGGALDADDHPTLGWSTLLDTPIQLASVAGNHYAMLQEPNVQVLAEEVQRFYQPLGV
ncbi:hypothetical protein CBW65_04080 [Tumebacillus avium]|uniref:Carrier domain-containing protein n=1 Tax=Tumebacillus avium TaxID=1903704 RepID=A0A1Y0IIK8_9BACL|nr:non-ribosomal peptide synthetase [Tumebacillus avium]ARU60331.1 hypothetical protein CBW65_04080 [Tumebacillus avium]